MMGSHSVALPSIETSALIARCSNPQSNDARTHKGRPWCDHCRKPRHFQDKCRKIYGKPVDWKPSRQNSNSQAFVDVPEEKPSGQSNLFSNEQIEMVKKMFGQPQTSTSSIVVGIGTATQKGNHLISLNSQNEKSKAWIVDSSASNHMSGNASLFDNYNPYTTDYSVKIADGTTSRVLGTGSIKLSESITLHCVLCVCISNLFSI